MKKPTKRLVFVLTSVIAICLSLVFVELTKNANVLEKKKLVILFTSDVHSGVKHGFGYDGLYAIRENYEKNGNYTLLVDNGDAIQGEPIGIMTRGEAVIELMNSMKYDVAVPGNHEFDYGMERFLELTKKANFPYISCNFNKEGKLVFKPYIIFTIGKRKVAFVGITTPTTLTSSTPKYFQNEKGDYIYSFCNDKTGKKLYDAVQEAVNNARDEGADFVIALAHIGNKPGSLPYTYQEIIGNTSGMDAFLDGHSHDTDQVIVKNKAGEDVIRLACGTKLEGIGWLKIDLESGKLDSGLYTWNNSVPLHNLLGIENRMTKVINETFVNFKQKLFEVVARTSVNLLIHDPKLVDSSGMPVRIIRCSETNLADLCADAIQNQTKADIAIVNAGGIRNPILAGNITFNDILKVFPFGNTLCVKEVTGKQILDALEWGARAAPSELGAFLQVSGLTYEIHTYIKSSCVSDENGMFRGVKGKYRVKNVKIAGMPLKLTQKYSVASINFILQNSGDGYSLFKDAKLLLENVKLDNQALLDYIVDTLGGNIDLFYANPYGDGRIKIIKKKR